ncbi:ADP-ribosylglycohydrolase family protein [Chroococcus sp. FPU101]|uniref:ADP-ribosylglycohydrolase family protein n=1 Tax=Chroococcus sp. FPU101 TaxID=1974212 RepID=UPI001A8E1C8F|nr:ADP-ribosylglycohydrolase family protein [Chroococcus sp. FPU101]GFE68114.1 probable ribosyl glycohydrolase [Chroococcus sp. FPU101]
MSNQSVITAGILGVCVGDALGLPVQFSKREERERFPISDMIGYGTYHQPPGTWSDDGSLTLCLVDALSQVSPNNSEKLLTLVSQNFCRWYTQGYLTPFNQAFDIGGTTERSVNHLLQGVSLKHSGENSEKSNGNGSLMRILPLAFCHDLLVFPELIKLTHLVSAITHAHLRSQIACGFYISIAIRLLAGESAKTAYLQGIEDIKKIYSKPPYIVELQHFSRITDGKIAQLKINDIASSGYVLHTLEASLWCLINSENYAEAVLKAVNLGDDTDTTAAVTGGLAGIYYGLESIPQHWIDQLTRRQDIVDLAEILATKLKSGY